MHNGRKGQSFANFDDIDHNRALPDGIIDYTRVLDNSSIEGVNFQ
jgi:hypothetical protein